MTLECSISWFLQTLERWVMLPCPVPTLEGLTGDKGYAWPLPDLISSSREWGTPCKDGNTRCWGPASCETELGEALLCAEGGRCCYSYPGRCCQAQDPGTQLQQSPSQTPVPADRSAGLAHLQLGCWQGFVYPQANLGLCPPGPAAHAGAVDAWLHPCGFPHSLDFLPTDGASETLGPGRVPGDVGLSSAPCSLHGSKGCSLTVPWADKERRLRAVPGTLKKVQGDKLGSAGRHLVPGAGPDPGRFTCSLIRERGGSRAGGEAACWNWPSRQALQEVVGEVLLCLISGLGQCAHSSWQLHPTPGGYCHEGGS